MTHWDCAHKSFLQISDSNDICNISEQQYQYDLSVLLKKSDLWTNFVRIEDTMREMTLFAN